MKEKQKNKSEEDWDDGRTIADMSMSGISKRYDYTNSEAAQIKKERSEKIKDLNLSKKEEKAMTWGIIKATLIPVICTIVGFLLTGLILYLWVNQGF